jgi:hypothetical protein
MIPSEEQAPPPNMGLGLEPPPEPMMGEYMTEEMEGMELSERAAPPAPMEPPPPAMEEPPEEEHFCDSDTAKWLSEIIDRLDRHDRFTRDTQIKKWRRQMCYWDGIQYIWWSDFARDWRTPEQIHEEDPQSDIDPALYAKVINVYRAYGEVIIAAMSSALPTVPFIPDDAENPDDITSAKAYTKIGMLIQKHNYAELLFMKALFILYNQGVVFGYNENRASGKYGVYEKPIVQDHLVVTREYYCANCGYSLGSDEVSANPMAPPDAPTGGVPPVGEEEMDPMNNPSPPDPYPQAAPPQAPSPSLPPAAQSPMGVQQCPQCGYENMPEADDFEDIIPRMVGYDKVPKSRECLEVYGPLNVKIAPWASKKEDTPYLILETEEHYAKLQDIYPEIAERIQPLIDLDTFDRSMRTNILFKGDVATDLCTTRRCWIAPWAFNVLGVESRKEDIATLKGLYPNGCYAVVINRDLVVEGIADYMWDHWTPTEHPLAETIHAESIGSGTVPIQDMTNEGWNLTLEGIEFGIPELYADPDVLDFDSYSRSEARPGQISPAKAPAGRSLGEGFFEARTASVSQEIDKFLNRLSQTGQFISGALPTVFGGAIQGGSGTAREYEMSRAQALQRLQITWKIVKIWWAQMLAKAVRSFALNMMEDEKYIEKRGSTYVNVWIRKIHLTGKVGEVEPDVNEAFPISWAQKRDMILQMLQGGNEDVAAVLRHPENAGLIALTIGVPELYIPGDDDRNKQLAEIAEMILTEPQMGPPSSGPPGAGAPPPGAGPALPEEPGMGGPAPPGPPEQQMMPQSTVPIEPTLDNHEVEMATCQAWLKSEVGLLYKKENPGAYLNVLLHMQAHQQLVQQAQAAEEEKMSKEKEGEGGPPQEK